MSDATGKKNPWTKLLANRDEKAESPLAPLDAPAAAEKPPPASIPPGKAAGAIPWGKTPVRPPAPAAEAKPAVPPAPSRAPATEAKPPTRPLPLWTPASDRAPAPVTPQVSEKRPSTARDAFRKPDSPAVARPPADPDPATRAPAEASPAAAGEQVSDELADALAKLAAEYAPVPVSNTVFITAREQELERMERRRQRRIALLKWIGKIAAVIAVLLLIATFALFRYPSDEALATEAQIIAERVLPLYSSADQPLRIDRAVAVLNDNFSSVHLRYFAEVTLRLREPLYGPAVTNGTTTYRQLQESLARARQLDLDQGLLVGDDAPKPPVLPRLIQMLHREGEPLVVRLSFEAKKFGWHWRLEPANLDKRTATGRLDGLPLARFENAPYLIFGRLDTMDEFRRRLTAARDYITAVAKAQQFRSAVGVSADTAAVDAPPAATAEPVPAVPVSPDQPAVDPNLITVPGLDRAFDPNKPAVFDPNKPAVAPDNSAKPK